MKVIAIAALAITLIASSSADEDKKTKVLKFWNCVSCHEDPVAREEYMKCSESKPEKCKQIHKDCLKEVIPETEVPEELWSAFCKAENDVPSRFFDCIMSHDLKKEMSDDEKTEFKEYLQCLKKIDKKFCEH